VEEVWSTIHRASGSFSVPRHGRAWKFKIRAWKLENPCLLFLELSLVVSNSTTNSIVLHIARCKFYSTYNIHINIVRFYNWRDLQKRVRLSVLDSATPKTINSFYYNKLTHTNRRDAKSQTCNIQTSTNTNTNNYINVRSKADK